MEQVTTPQSQPVSYKKFNIIKIISMLLFIILPFVGFWAGIQYQKSIISSKLFSSIQPIKPHSPIPNETANWKTYRNEKYGFELIFNNEWEGFRVQEVRVGSDKEIANIVFEIPISIQRLTNDKPYPWFSPFYIQILPIRLYEPDSLLSNESILIQNGTYIFKVVIYDSPEKLLGVDLKVDQILSTFRFLDKDNLINAGNSCIDSKDCSMECITRDGSVPGICPTYETAGCYYLVENGKVTDAQMCFDPN